MASDDSARSTPNRPATRAEQAYQPSLARRDGNAARAAGIACCCSVALRRPLSPGQKPREIKSLPSTTKKTPFWQPSWASGTGRVARRRLSFHDLRAQPDRGALRRCRSGQVRRAPCMELRSAVIISRCWRRITNSAWISAPNFRTILLVGTFRDEAPTSSMGTPSGRAGRTGTW